MQRNYRPWIVLFITISSAVSLYTNHQREKEIKSEKQQSAGLFEEQAKQQEAADAAYGAWNEANEKLVYDMYYQQGAGAHIANSIRAEYAACCLGKIKAMFPKGLSNINDIIKVKEMKIDAQCIESVNLNLKVWQPEFKKILKKKFYAFPEVKVLPEGVRAAFVDCLIGKVMAKFPDGMIKGREKALKELVSAARQECVFTAMEGYKKPADKEEQKLPVVKDTSATN